MTASPGRIYSLPSNILSSDDADGPIFKPLTTALRPHELQDDQHTPRPPTRLTCLDMYDDEDTAPPPADITVFSLVAHQHASRARVISVPAAAGTKVGPDELLCVQHLFADIQGAGAEQSGLISVSPVLLAQNPVMVLSCLGDTVHEDPQLVKSWQVGANISYTLSGLSGHRDHRAMVPLVTAFVHASAFPGKGSYLCEDIGDLELLSVLEALSYVSCIDEGPENLDTWSRWHLTPLALQQLVPCRFIHSPTSAFENRGVPHGQMTRFELLQELLSDGWQWRSWSQRHALPAFSISEDGPGEKLFTCRGAKIGIAYMLCLLTADMLRERSGQPTLQIPHGRAEAFYRKLMETNAATVAQDQDGAAGGQNLGLRMEDAHCLI